VPQGNVSPPYSGSKGKPSKKDAPLDATSLLGFTHSSGIYIYKNVTASLYASGP
jgi:hypothetical protein